MDKATVVERVQRNLDRHRLPDADLQVVADDVKQDNGFWYVPVRASRPLTRTFELYDTLAEAEGELDENEGLSILFVPVYELASATGR